MCVNIQHPDKLVLYHNHVPAVLHYNASLQTLVCSLKPPGDLLRNRMAGKRTYYSGTSIDRTPLGPGEVSPQQRCLFNRLCSGDNYKECMSTVPAGNQEKHPLNEGVPK